jgi:lysophospholipase L1-like esterase
MQRSNRSWPRSAIDVVALFLAASALAADTASPRPTPTPTPIPVPDCADVARAIDQMMRQDYRLRDWPNFARYRADNAALPAPGAEPRVVFMGDSITDNWDRVAPFFPGKPYVNRGISGQTTPQMLLRFRPDVLALAPKVVVILAGTNDLSANTGATTNEDIQGHLASMAELATVHGVRVVMSSILPVSDHRTTPLPEGQMRMTARRPPARINAINAWMKRYAAEKGHVYLDYFSALADESGLLRKELADDGLHPNAKGYEIMAPLAEKAVAQALGRGAAP